MLPYADILLPYTAPSIKPNLILSCLTVTRSQSPLGYYDPAMRGSTPSAYFEALGFESPFPKSPEEAAWAQKQQQQQLAAFYGLAAGATGYQERMMTPAGFYGGFPPAGPAAAAVAAPPQYGKVPMPCSPRSYNANTVNNTSSTSNSNTTSNNNNQPQLQGNGSLRLETVT